MKNLRFILIAALFVAAMFLAACDFDDDNENKSSEQPDTRVEITVYFDISKIKVTEGNIDVKEVQNNSTIKEFTTLNVAAINLEDGYTVDYWKINGEKKTDKSGTYYQEWALTKDVCQLVDGKYVYGIEVVLRKLNIAAVTFDTDYAECFKDIMNKKPVASGETVNEKEASEIYFNINETRINADYDAGKHTYVYGYTLNAEDHDFLSSVNKRYVSVALTQNVGGKIDFKFLTRDSNSAKVTFDSTVLTVTKNVYAPKGEDKPSKASVESDNTLIYEGEIVNLALVSGAKIEAEKIYVNNVSLEKFNRLPFFFVNGKMKVYYSASNFIEPNSDGKFVIEYRN